MIESIRVASVRYFPKRQLDFPGYLHEIQNRLELAVAEGAELVVFPEYASFELSSIGKLEKQSLPQELENLQVYHADFKRGFANLAQRYGLYLLAPTFPVREKNTFFNRAYFCAPNGKVVYQDKLQMTRFENERWGISAGTSMTIIDTPFCKMGIAICYDSEFPSLVAKMVGLGVELILVPSCTDTLAGFNRVRLAARTRAMENQCYTVLSGLHGLCPWSEAIDQNIGTSGIYGPVDSQATPDGIVAEQKLSKESELTVASIDFALARSIRSDGDVLLFKDSSRLSVYEVSYQEL